MTLWRGGGCQCLSEDWGRGDAPWVEGELDVQGIGQDLEVLGELADAGAVHLVGLEDQHALDVVVVCQGIHVLGRVFGIPRQPGGRALAVGINSPLCRRRGESGGDLEIRSVHVGLGGLQLGHALRVDIVGGLWCLVHVSKDPRVSIAGDTAYGLDRFEIESEGLDVAAAGRRRVEGDSAVGIQEVVGERVNAPVGDLLGHAVAAGNRAVVARGDVDA